MICSLLIPEHVCHDDPPSRADVDSSQCLSKTGAHEGTANSISVVPHVSRSLITISFGHKSSYMKILFTILGCSTVLIAPAQTSLEYANWPVAGQSLTMYVLTDPGSAQAPTPGINQTWDYSSVTFAQAGTAAIAPAAGTPYAASFPEANYVYSVTPTGMATGYNYMLVNSTSVQNVATDVPADPNVYTDYNQILQFPIQFGGSFTDSYASPDNTGSSTWLAAGDGTLITSFGTFTDVVLLYDQANDDLVFWNSSPIFPRLISNSSGVTMFMPGTVGMEENGMGMAQPIVFPNPASSALQVVGSEAHSTWRIVDLQGREMLQGSWTDAGGRTIDIQTLANGQYVLISIGEHTSTAARFVKS
jgi:hypothetical protein